MKIAYVHALPLEYYPPAANALTLISRRSGWAVKAWSSANRRGLGDWEATAVDIRRPRYPNTQSWLPLRIAGYLRWHLRTAAELAAWGPDAVISVEPHSALAVWLYYRVFQGKAPLFIHHHEYYAPEDFSGPGMRVLRATRRLERRDLFPRARWVSQTNDERMRLLRAWNPGIPAHAARILPNYPPQEWVMGAATIPRQRASARLRLVYLGSASFEDAFIREIANWVAGRPQSTSLHVCGNNVSPDVWEWLHSLAAPNITREPRGHEYANLPKLLRRFDVGLVLYKGNTLNFVHNVPNKAIEYLACGLEVWYPPEMEGMSNFHRRHSKYSMRAVDFNHLPDAPPHARTTDPLPGTFPFTCEAAMAPLIAELEKLDIAPGR